MTKVFVMMLPTTENTRQKNSHRAIDDVPRDLCSLFTGSRDADKRTKSHSGTRGQILRIWWRRSGVQNTWLAAHLKSLSRAQYEKHHDKKNTHCAHRCGRPWNKLAYPEERLSVRQAGQLSVTWANSQVGFEHFKLTFKTKPR